MPRPDFDPAGTVRVAGYDFTISQNHPGAAGLVDEGRQGFCNHHQSTISVCEHLAPDVKAETVLHELVHACELAVSADLSEEQVGRVARALYAVCRDNPEYMGRLLVPEGMSEPRVPDVVYVYNPITEKWEAVDVSTGRVTDRAVDIREVGSLVRWTRTVPAQGEQ